MAESEEELKSLLIKVKEESEYAGLKRNIKKTIRSFGTDVGKLEPCTLLMEMLNDVATLKNSLCVCVCVCVC